MDEQTAERIVEIEANVLRAMGLPQGALYIDGDSLYTGNVDCQCSDEQRHEFQDRVLTAIKDAGIVNE